MSPPSQCCVETLQLYIFEMAHLISVYRFLAARSHDLTVQRDIMMQYTTARASHEHDTLTKS